MYHGSGTGKGSPVCEIVHLELLTYHSYALSREINKILKGPPVSWRLLGPPEYLAENPVLKPNAPKHNRDVTLKSRVGQMHQECLGGISLLTGNNLLQEAGGEQHREEET